MKPKLLVCTSTFPRWQNDTDPPFVYELSKRLTADFAVTVHAPHYPGALRNEEMEQIKVHRFRYFFALLEKLAGATGILPTLRQNKLNFCLLPFFLVAQFFSLCILVRKTRPAIIHAHWILPQGFFAVIVNIIFGVPVVVTAHGGDVFGLQHSLLKAAKRFVLKRAARVSAVSSALREKIVREIYPVQVEVIPMGVCSDIFSGKKKALQIKEEHVIHDKVILYVGRLSEKKGVRYLIDAMPEVLKPFPMAKLLIIGSGELEQDLHHQVSRRNLQDSIVFIGSVPNRDLPVYYVGSDVFVGPSVEARGGDTEGFGLTFVEAAMSGCLLIGCDVGGIRDIIEDNVTGFLVPAKDSKALAEKIIYVLKNMDDVKEMAERARKRCIEKFDWQTIAKLYAQLLREAKN